MHEGAIGKIDEGAVVLLLKDEVLPFVRTRFLIDYFGGPDFLPADDLPLIERDGIPITCDLEIVIYDTGDLVAVAHSTSH